MTLSRPRRITLADEADVDGFRREARQLLRDGVAPGDVEWQVATAESADLFGDGGDAPVPVGPAAANPADSVDPAAPADTGAAAAAAAAASGPVATDAGPPADALSPISVPAFFVPLCEQAALHADPGRFGLLYRLLWRLVHEPALRGDALDPDRLEAEKMSRMVRRDMHKMTAFVRFRPIGSAPSDAVMSVGAAAERSAGGVSDMDDHDHLNPNPHPNANFCAPADADADADAPAADIDLDPDPDIDSGSDDTQEGADFKARFEHADHPSTDAAARPGAGSAAHGTPAAAADLPVDDRWHVAWFEPAHHIVAATAPFFARRFAQMKWAILTPERCVRWDGRALAFGPGASRAAAPPADAGEQLWLTYYAHIFNPARLKLAMMQKEMPRRYWHNLPEAALIQPLTAAAHRRSGQMVAQGGSEPTHRRPAASMAMRIEPPATRGAVPAAAPDSLSALGAALQRCRECPIGEGATQAVPGAGLPVARLMLVGEQPGDQEDLRGQPFVGPAGQLLDKAFAQLGWPRQAVYLTNAVKHFKYELRGKRRIHKSPSQREAAACLHWLEAEIELVAPKALVALGATAARALLGRPVGVTLERGHWLARGDGLQVLIALHPSALLRMEPADRESAYQAWLGDLARAASYVAEPA